MAKVITFFNQKGGTGKTTTVINIAGVLAENGFKVLIVDTDAQGSATIGLGIDPSALELTLYDALLRPREVSLEDMIYEIRDNIDAVPTNIGLSQAEVALVSASRREDRLRNALKPILGDYDYVLIDSPPYIGQLVLNALTASDGVVIPMSTDYYAMAGVKLAINTIEDVQYDLNPKLKILGILLTRYSRQTIQAQEVCELVRETYKNKIRVFDAVIRETIKIKEAPAASETITEYAPNHPVATDYRKLGAELVNACKTDNSS